MGLIRGEMKDSGYQFAINPAHVVYLTPDPQDPSATIIYTSDGKTLIIKGDFQTVSVDIQKALRS